MKHNFFVLISLLLCLTILSQKPYVSKVWLANQGNGSYKNPILYADYSDPDAVQVGEDYFLGTD